MFQVSVARLYEDNREKLGLSCLGKAGDALVARDGDDNAALIGYLNFTHPNRIQVVGPQEVAYLAGLEEPVRLALLESLSRRPAAAFFACEGIGLPAPLARIAQAACIPILTSTEPGARVIEVLQRYMTKRTAAVVQRHGVCMDVLGLGLLITGESGVGKSELGLELISRGHGLVADDVVDICRLSSSVLECRCPPMLKDFLEVRGLGVLNIRTVFGETAVRPKMNLRLIVGLEKHAAGRERLPLHELSEEILGVTVRKVVIPVAEGRNLAVLVEAAVRNYILQLRGINSTEQFMARQQLELGKDT